MYQFVVLMVLAYLLRKFMRMIFHLTRSRQEIDAKEEVREEVENEEKSNCVGKEEDVTANNIETVMMKAAAEAKIGAAAEEDTDLSFVNIGEERAASGVVNVSIEADVETDDKDYLVFDDFGEEVSATGSVNVSIEAAVMETDDKDYHVFDDFGDEGSATGAVNASIKATVMETDDKDFLVFNDFGQEGAATGAEESVNAFIESSMVGATSDEDEQEDMVTVKIGDIIPEVDYAKGQAGVSIIHKSGTNIMEAGSIGNYGIPFRKLGKGEVLLPAEVWEKILMHLSVRDLCRVAASSKHLYFMASQPWLWTGVKINRLNMITWGLGDLLSINRFSKLTSIDLSHMSFTRDQIVEVLNDLIDSNVDSVDLTAVNLADIDETLLARAVCGLDKIVLGDNDLSGDQCQAILSSSLCSDTLKDIKFRYTDLLCIPTALLASSLTRLTSLTLEFASITDDQMEAVLTASLASTSLQDLTLKGLNLSNLDPQLISDAARRLSRLDLTCQADRGFSYLNYLGNNYHIYITTEQVTSLLTGILSSNTLKDVNLSYINLSQVSPYLLSRAVASITRVNISNSDLSPGQLTSILKFILKSSTLEYISLEAVSLASTPPELLARAISCLKSVNLNYCCLTVDQCNAIFKEAKVPRRMEVKGVDALQEVDKELLEAAKRRIKILM